MSSLTDALKDLVTTGANAYRDVQTGRAEYKAEKNREAELKSEATREHLVAKSPLPEEAARWYSSPAVMIGAGLGALVLLVVLLRRK